MSTKKAVSHEAEVHSWSKPNKKYTVRIFIDDSFWCTCPHFKFRHKSLPNGCKHIQHVVLGLGAKRKNPALVTYDNAFKRDRLVATFRPIEMGETKSPKRGASQQRRSRARKLEL